MPQRLTQYAVAIHDGRDWTVLLEDAPDCEAAFEEAITEWPFEAYRIDIRPAQNVDTDKDGCPIRGHPLFGPSDPLFR